MLNKKHNLKSGKSKDKKKIFQTENKTGNQKEKRFQEKNIAIEYFDVVLFMKQKQRRKKRKKETNTRNKRKATRRKVKRKEQQRDREREIEKGGGQKRQREKERETLKINKNALFRGKNRFFVY